MLLAQARRSYIGHSSETKPRNTFRGRITGNGSHRQKLGRIAGKLVTPKYLGWKMSHTDPKCPKYFGVTHFPAMRPLKVLRGLVSEL